MSKARLSDREIVTPPCRLAFPALFKPRARMKGDPNSKESYQAVVLIPPDVDITPFKRAARAALVERFGENAAKKKINHFPIRPCDEKTELDGYEEGWHFINTHSGTDFPPGVIDRKLQPVVDPDRVYAGCWCRFHLVAFAWEFSGRRGVSFSLSSVQVVDDGERLDGRKDPAMVFEALDDVESDEVAPSGGDVEDLFG